MRLRQVAALGLLALCALAPYAVAQTYTNKNLPGVTAYSGFAGAPTAGVFAPYSYDAPCLHQAQCRAHRSSDTSSSRRGTAS